MARNARKVHSKYIVVTGAAGFIGGQTALALQDAGHRVIGIDWRSLPAHLVGSMDMFLQEDFSSGYVLNTISNYNPMAIIHCAGTSLVGPSLKDPRTYFNNNFIKTKIMMDHIVDNAIPTRVIFSSSSSVYGEPDVESIPEHTRPNPISPYGQSKLMVEMLLTSYQHAYQIPSVVFRYFNAAGADPGARHGQNAKATHIVARILESLRDDQEFVLYGDDYDTPDGTCVRDHVHVMDVARAHVMAAEGKFDSGIYNLGLNRAVSNREVMDRAESITGQTLKHRVGPRRLGDPRRLQADCGRSNLAGWHPEYNLDDMLMHAWRWYTK